MIIHRCHNHHYHWKLKAVCPAFCLKESAAKAIWQSGNILQSLPILFVAQEKKSRGTFCSWSSLPYTLCINILYNIYNVFVSFYCTSLANLGEKASAALLLLQKFVWYRRRTLFLRLLLSMLIFVYFIFILYFHLYIFSRNLSDTSGGRFFSSCSYHIKPKNKNITIV